MCVTPDQIEALGRFDTCVLANAIEQMGVRLRNEGYTGSGLTCYTPNLPTVVGFAATARVKSNDPPLAGHPYLDRTDWWSSFALGPQPAIAVIANIDEPKSSAAVAGEIHSLILRRLGCRALIANGAIRDLPALLDTGLALFGDGLCPSHGYLHMVGFGEPVEVHGLKIAPGDLLACDRHGVLAIPPAIAGELPRVAAMLKSRERRIVDLCSSPEFTLDALRREVEK